MRLYLAGPKAGETLTLQGVRFIKGIAELPPGSAGLVNYFGRFYMAFPEFSTELATALETHGGKEIYYGRGGIPQHRAGADGKLQPAGGTPAAPPAVDESLDANPPAGAAERVSTGDGQEDTGLPSVKAEVERICLLLNPRHPGHWTASGSAKYTEVMRYTASRDISRTDLNSFGLSRKQVADRQLLIERK